MSQFDEPSDIDSELTDTTASDMSGSNDNVSAQSEHSFEDLTLAEAFAQLFRSPLRTLYALLNVAETPVNLPVPDLSIPVSQRIPRTVQVDPTSQSRRLNALLEMDRRQWMQIGLSISAFSLAFWGCLILVSADTRYEAAQLHEGTPFLLLGFIIWLGAEIYADWDTIRVRWERFRAPPGDVGTPHVLPAQAITNIEYDQSDAVPFSTYWQGIHPVRVFAGIGTIVFALIAWEGTANNRFSFFGFWGWVISIVLVLVAVAPAMWTPMNLIRWIGDWLSSVRLRGNSTLLALLFVCLLGGYFRLHNLVGVPPEMTSDHIEKILDSQRVVEGDRDVFFTNNGGREAFQMYAMALFSRLPGQGMNFTTLKLLSVLEGMITLPLLWWMGREVIGEHNPRLANTVGLILAALVAVSYWHVAISRLALRIILTPLVTSLLLVFLTRGMRHNRRGDFVLAGLVLGFGLYTYQAVRMLPVVVVIGVILAFFFRFKDSQMRRRYARNLAILVVVSFVIFVPLFRFSVDYPDAFWMRTAGRLFGDDVIQETNAAGILVERKATLDERWDAFRHNLPVLTSNIRNALLMYNWKGDVAWINGVPNYPVMDSVTGAFLIVGCAAWLALIIRKRDPVYLLIPIMLIIMLLPSALSIAAPLENPSATRASGSLPPAYLIAALPLALLVVKLQDVLIGHGRRIVPIGMVAVVVSGAFFVNLDTYFNDYLQSYDNSWKPHSEPGRILRGFAMSDGSYGNAFIIHHEHWLDHRIVGLEAGILDWTNAIISRDAVPDFLYDAYNCVEYKYRIDPERDLLFFYHQLDKDTAEQLSDWFPEGHSVLIESRLPQHSFYIYRVPAMGYEGLQQWLDEHKQDPRCWYRSP